VPDSAKVPRRFLAAWKFSRGGEASLSGGISRLDVLTNTGGAGSAFEDGHTSFFRADLALGNRGLKPEKITQFELSYKF
jgi:hypothetical protein